MFHRKSRETKPEPVVHITEFIRLLPEYRSKYEPTLLERRLLETFTLEETGKALRFSASSRSLYMTWSTTTIPIENIFGTPYFDKQTDEIVLPILEGRREIPQIELERFQRLIDRQFALIKEGMQSLAKITRDIKRIEPMLGENGLFILKTP